MGTEIAYECEV